MHCKFLAIAAMVPFIIVAVHNPVIAGSLTVGGKAYTEYGYEASQGKEEPSLTRVHGGNFKVEAPLGDKINLTIKGNSEVLVDKKESETELGLMLSYDMGNGWKLYLGDDYIWKLERLNPKEDSLSQILSASILGKFAGGMTIALTGEKSWERFYWRPEKSSLKSEVSFSSTWKPLKDIFVEAKVVRKDGNYQEEPWRNYVERSLSMKVTAPLGDKFTGLIEGKLLKKEFPDGTRYSDYDKWSLRSQLTWNLSKDLVVILRGKLIEKIAWQRPSSDYRTRSMDVKVIKEYGNNITMTLKTSLLQKDFPNVDWGSSDYRERLFGMGIKNRILSDLTFFLDVEHKDRWYLKKDSVSEETSVDVRFEKILSKDTELNLGIERIKRSISSDSEAPDFETIFKAELTHDISKDIEAKFSCQYSTTEESDRKIGAEVKYSFK